jgi:cellulose biosynthesis protein BcsQ
MTQIFAMINMRGGVGKTTTTVSVGYELARLGYRVLLGDFDSQRTLTVYLGIEVKPGKPTVYAFMTEPTEANVRGGIVPYVGTAKYPVSFPGKGCLHVLPGARSITTAYKQFMLSQARQPAQSYNAAIAYGVQTFLTDYDFFLCDPSPSADETTAAVTNAAHRVVAPVAAEPLSIFGVDDLLQDLTDINDGRADLLTTLAQKQARVRLPQEVILEGLLAAKVLPSQRRVAESLWTSLDHNGIGHFGHTYIPCTDAGWAAPAEHVPIAVIAPTDPIVVGYHAVAEQLAAH